MKKATPLHPFSRQQDLFLREGTAPHRADGIEGFSGSQQEQPLCSPCSVATWQLVPAGERDAGLDPVGGLWWDAFAFPERMDSFTPKQWHQNKRLLLDPRPCAAFGLC